MSSSRTPLVIAGAGPVGLSLALGLARRGVPSVVLEKKDALSQHSKAIAVLTRTLEIFKEWGILDEVQQRGQFLKNFTVFDGSGRDLVHFNMDCLDPISSVAGVCVMPQSATEEILLQACLSTGLVEVRFGHAVDSYTAEAQQVRTRVVGPDGQYQIESSFLCGCDGSKSVVRAQLGFELEGKTYPAHAILADVKIEDDRDQASWPRGNLKAQGLHAVVRFAPNYWRLIIARPGGTNEEPPTSEFVRASVSELLGDGPMEIIWSSAFRIHLRNSPFFRVGRVALLGDAAHLNSPAGGQGMNGGIQDAHNLAWKIAAIESGSDAEMLLNSYDEERQDAIINGIDVTTDRLTRVGIFMSPGRRALMLKLLRVGLKFGGTQTRVLKGFSMLGYRYDEGSIIHESGGSYVPDLLMENVRLRDAIGKDGGLVEVAGKLVLVNGQRYECPAAKKALGGKYVTVRPDHVIAYAGKSRSTAEAYLVWK